MPVALVTGASRGVGRGVVIALAGAGYTVFATGRSIDSSELPHSVVRIPCDHRFDMGQHDGRRCPCRLHCFRPSRRDNGFARLRIDREYELLGSAKVLGQLNLLYGIAEVVTDKTSSDMAHELRPHNVAVVSLYPGLVRTEAVMEAASSGWLDISNSERPEFIGKVNSATTVYNQYIHLS